MATKKKKNRRVKTKIEHLVLERQKTVVFRTGRKKAFWDEIKTAESEGHREAFPPNWFLITRYFSRYARTHLKNEVEKQAFPYMQLLKHKELIMVNWYWYAWKKRSSTRVQFT